MLLAARALCAPTLRGNEGLPTVGPEEVTPQRSLHLMEWPFPTGLEPTALKPTVQSPTALATTVQSPTALNPTVIDPTVQSPTVQSPTVTRTCPIPLRFVSGRRHHLKERQALRVPTPRRPPTVLCRHGRAGRVHQTPKVRTGGNNARVYRRSCNCCVFSFVCSSSLLDTTEPRHGEPRRVHMRPP